MYRLCNNISYVCVCAHVYIYIYIHMCVCVYIYIYDISDVEYVIFTEFPDYCAALRSLLTEPRSAFEVPITKHQNSDKSSPSHLLRRVGTKTANVAS